jgi:hypothetical protein
VCYSNFLLGLFLGDNDTILTFIQQIKLIESDFYLISKKLNYVVYKDFYRTHDEALPKLELNKNIVKNVTVTLKEMVETTHHRH